MVQAVYVGPASELRRRSLLLRTAQHSLSEYIDPTTERAGDLPLSLIDDVFISNDRVRVVFRDGTEIACDVDEQVEAVSP